MLYPSAIATVSFDSYGNTTWTSGHVSCMHRSPFPPIMDMPEPLSSTAGSTHGPLAAPPGTITETEQWYLSLLEIYRALTKGQLLCHAHAIDKVPSTFASSCRRRNKLLLLVW